MNRSHGFTIPELMLVVAVLGIAVTIAVPNMNAFILNNRLTSQLNMLASSLALARSEAIKRNETVVVCVSSDGEACTAGEDWNTGWLVFVDRAGGVADGALDLAEGSDGCASEPDDVDCLLVAQQTIPGVNTLRAAGDVANSIAFVGSGEARCDSDADGVHEETCTNADSYFVVCDQRADAHARGLAVSNTGRTSVVETQPNGDPLACTP